MKEIITLLPNDMKLGRLKRVAAYARVSVDSDPMLHSLDAQITYYRRLIQNNSDWELAGVFADRGISGTKVEKREAFLELIKKCEKGQIDIILCKSISRFARNTVDLLEAIRYLKYLGVEVRFERERISTFSKEGELILTILASFAQEESRSISENVKWGMRKQYASGEAVSWNKHVYGYRYDDELKQYIIIPDEAAVVREIYGMFLEGKSFHQIAADLNKRGFTTTNGCNFDKGTIGRIISNEIYTGDIMWQKKYVESYLTKVKKVNNGEFPKYIYHNCHEAIIKREDFERASEIRKQRKNKYCRHIFGYEYNYELNRYFIISEEAEIIRFIFKMYLEWYNFAEIAVKITELGIRTVRGNNFTRYSIGNIVRNDFYGNSVTVETADVGEACHEAILEDITYARVLIERERRSVLQWKQF